MNNDSACAFNEPEVARDGQPGISPVCLPRRAVLGGMVGGALLALLGNERADGQVAVAPDTMHYSSGFFQVPATEQGIIAVLIGLLLPAVRRPKAPFRAALMDSAGNVYPLTFPGGSGDDTFAAYFAIRNRYDGDKRVLVVGDGRDRGIEIPTADGILIALLLPAVQRDGTPVGPRSASVNVLMGDGSVRHLLPYIEQDNLYRAGNPGGGATFIGPVMMGQGENALIGLLLPAVQKVQSPFRLQITDGTSNTVMVAEIMPRSTGPTSSFFDVFVGDNGWRIMRDGKPVDLLSAPKNNILIGMLLPAVQKVREAASRVPALGGSLMLPNATVAFHPSSMG